MTKAKDEDQNFPGAVPQTPGGLPNQPIPASQRGMNNPDPVTGESAAEIEARQEPYDHPELIVQARREAGFNRAGFRFSGQSKTLIPANSLSKERYDAIINERQLVVVEKPKAALKEDAVEAEPVHKSTVALMNKGELAIGGAGENATPAQLEAAANGKAMGHPSFGSAVSSGATSGSLNRALDPELEEEADSQAEARTKKAAKKAEKESK